MTEQSIPSLVGGIPVYGGDAWTRCKHYHQDIDIIAIKHVCCNQYYPCHLCHEEIADHPAVPWPASQFDDEAVLCGSCGREITVNAYLATADCPNCQAAFNPGCKSHASFYFETQ